MIKDNKQANGILFIISGPSGTGKTSLVQALLNKIPNLALSISCTTRCIRPGEIPDVHYHFMQLIDFKRDLAAGMFLEHAEVFGNYYGTRINDVRAHLNTGQDLILEIDWQGARQVRANCVDTVGIFILPPSLSELTRRLSERKTDSAAEITRRLTKAQNEIEHASDYNYLIVNDNFDKALLDLESIVIAERLRLARQREKLAEILTA